jgi:hypothetical protein
MDERTDREFGGEPEQVGGETVLNRACLNRVAVPSE